MISTRNIERALIGSFLLNPKHFFNHQDALKPEYLTDEKMKVLFQLIKDGYSQNERIDKRLLLIEVSKHFVFELDNLVQLSGEANASSNSDYIDLLKERYNRSQLLDLSNQVRIQAKQEMPVGEILSSIDAKLNDILIEDNQKSIGHVSESIKESLDTIIKARSTNGLSGIDTGFRDMNVLTGGWQPSDLIILAARAGLGKTTMASNYTLNVAKVLEPCAFFSLEMSKSQMINVLVSIMTGVSTQDMRNGTITDDDLALITQALGELDKMPLFIYDNKFTISDISTTCRFLNRKYDLKFICVDYLQLVDSGLSANTTKNSKVEHVSRSLKLLAKSEDFTALVLSQLSRAVETRGGDKRPMLSDLRDSGAIEQDADMIQFLFRESYYDYSDNPTAELIIAKNRHGDQGRFYREFKDRTYHEVEQMELTQFPVKEFKI